MASDHNPHCPEWLSPFLDNWVRRSLQNPMKILSPYVREGMTVADLGCGPGVFSVALAELVGERGRVYAVDIEDGMLERVRRKAEKMGLGSRITAVKAQAARLGVPEKADFALAFYMVHEVPDRAAFFSEVSSFLKPGGRLLVVEPNIHVGGIEFGRSVAMAQDAGLRRVRDVKVFFSRAALLERV
jgi:ubiquinone/menaquinone biosynthesis C-methylase UbiE